MSRKTAYKDLEAEILLERKENQPQTDSRVQATILAINPKGIYLDLNKCFEGHINLQELGSRSVEEFTIGDQIEVQILGEDKNQTGTFRSSIKQIEDESRWDKLDELKNKNLEVKVHRIQKSGIEVEIESTKQIGFIPFGYLDSKQEALNGKKREEWTGIKIPARLHEVSKEKNKIILNNKVITDELKEAKAQEVISSLSIGQVTTGVVVRTTDFGVFVDLGGLDALIPSSELSWRRFKKPSDVAKIGDKLEAKIFKIEQEQKRVALSVKQLEPDPWSILPEELKIGYRTKAKFVTHADFGAFAEILPGVEALLHKSNYPDGEPPEIGSELELEVINLDAAKKRLGIKLIENSQEKLDDKPSPTTKEDEKELEHV